MSFSDETLGAYIDGELDAQERAAIETAMREDREIVRRIDRLRAVQNQLQSAFSTVVQEPVPQRLLDTLQKTPSVASVADLVGARSARKSAPRRWTWPELGAIAATLVVGTVLGYFLLRSPDADLFVKRDGALLARGSLAIALSNQLASEQPRDALVRIGVSFRDHEGAYCRTFALQKGRDFAGLACRENQGWLVETLARYEPTAGGAEPAGSALPPKVLRAVESRIVGEPLDAAGEAGARQSNWGPH